MERNKRISFGMRDTLGQWVHFLSDSPGTGVEETVLRMPSHLVSPLGKTICTGQRRGRPLGDFTVVSIDYSPACSMDGISPFTEIHFVLWKFWGRLYLLEML